jgi:hypothetical protein
MSARNSNRISEPPSETQPMRSSSKNADNSLEVKKAKSKKMKLDE